MSRSAWESHKNRADRQVGVKANVAQCLGVGGVGNGQIEFLAPFPQRQHVVLFNEFLLNQLQP